MSKLRRGLTAIVVILAATMLCAQGKGVKKRRPLPNEYGNVVMSETAAKGGVAPVLFSHWLHRSRFTCRLCHVDIGFGMEANSTGVLESANQSGAYCGTCHNGQIAFSVQARDNCERCHSVGKGIALAHDFATFANGLPRGRFGNNIDWEQAEIEGKIHLTDTLPGVSVKRRPLEVQKDYSIEAKVAGLPEIIFSHKKHATWNGCELCHPEIFTVKAGGTKFGMEDIFAGRYCGACHESVAFPVADCQRCHVKPVA